MVCEEVAPDNEFFGIMLPYAPIHHLLLREPLRAVVATSGNISEEPIVRTNQEALSRLRGIADYFLMHNREIHQRVDDSVIRVVGEVASFIRRSRGYAPMPVFLDSRLKGLPPALGVGGELKNTFCLLRQNQAFLSQHIGDMENLETYEYFLSALEGLKRLLSVEPQVVGYDMHPLYLTTSYAMELSQIQKVPVQHHHAHIVSCMAENGEMGPLIGVALDGTGYGADGTIWGGEILFSYLHSFERIGHLEPVRVISSDTTAKYPWKMALSLLFRSYGEGAVELGRELLPNIEDQKIRLTVNILRAGFNTITCSSTGRLFDGIAALLGIRMKNAYEGQAPMELEMSQAKARVSPYEVALRSEGDKLVLLSSPILEGVVRDIKEGRTRGIIARRFHVSLVELLARGVERACLLTGTKKVALSGGSFQ
ncbi:MAG: Sua5/YciO/YrdC/YwlC family protein, partial [Desulfatiglandales bacterium]